METVANTHDATGKNPQHRHPVTKTVMLIVFLLVPVLVGFVGSMLTTNQVDGWYASADQAPWTPPNAVFGPVWTALYLIMGLAAWLVWLRPRSAGRRTALTWFVAQLALNSVWSPAFFGGYPLWGSAALWIAFAIIVALLVSLVMTIRQFWSVRTLAAVLLLPYLLWVTYASTLNLYMALFN
ncbi:MAG: TspO/MBR family protein [Micrococcaceae bacterium]